ncbi:hypothetical protein ARZXY2_4778 (plasmid) [Arthrobacter sp. ZXY-2]|nr:hypothetical protein ARZXY2_4778 [Arthrobacter sp. ZXY-2]
MRTNVRFIYLSFSLAFGRVLWVWTGVTDEHAELIGLPTGPQRW